MSVCIQLWGKLLWTVIAALTIVSKTTGWVASLGHAAELSALPTSLCEVLQLLSGDRWSGHNTQHSWQ